MCFLYSTINLNPKAEIQKHFPMEKIIFEVIFPIFLLDDNLKLFSPFIFLVMSFSLL